MTVVFVGDDHHRYFQERQVETLASRVPELEVIYWSTVGLEPFSKLDLAAKDQSLFLIGSRHGAIPAVHWCSLNPTKVARLILLHPSLHLNIPGLESPQPHFVSTMMICHNKVNNPNYEELATLAGRFFHDYALHLTDEPAELASTLKLLSLTTNP